MARADYVIGSVIRVGLRFGLRVDGIVKIDDEPDCYILTHLKTGRRYFYGIESYGMTQINEWNYGFFLRNSNAAIRTDTLEAEIYRFEDWQTQEAESKAVKGRRVLEAVQNLHTDEARNA